MDWRTGHLTTTEGTGSGFLPTKIARRAGHLNNFFKCPGYARGFARGFARGGCSRLELTHTLETSERRVRVPFKAKKIFSEEHLER